MKNPTVIQLQYGKRKLDIHLYFHRESKQGPKYWGYSNKKEDIGENTWKNFVIVKMNPKIIAAEWTFYLRNITEKAHDSI